MLLAMYLPAIPIPTLRTDVPGDVLLQASAYRMLTSRLFWLFTSMSFIVFIDEGKVTSEVLLTSFDVSTRSLFETISAYAGSGMTLPVSSTAPYSFSGYLSWPSKLVLVLVMLAGRHRAQNLGMNLGLDKLD